MLLRDLFPAYVDLLRYEVLKLKFSLMFTPVPYPHKSCFSYAWRHFFTNIIIIINFILIIVCWTLFFLLFSCCIISSTLSFENCTISCFRNWIKKRLVNSSLCYRDRMFCLQSGKRDLAFSRSRNELKKGSKRNWCEQVKQSGNAKLQGMSKSIQSVTMTQLFFSFFLSG